MFLVCQEMPKPLSLQTVLQLLLEISSVLMFLNEQRLVLRNLDINHIQVGNQLGNQLRYKYKFHCFVKYQDMLDSLQFLTNSVELKSLVISINKPGNTKITIYYNLLQIN